MIKETSCCGLREIDGLMKEPKDNIHGVINQRENSRFCSVLFTDIQSSPRGKDLCKFIRDNKLGRVTVTGKMLNPNSGNEVTAYIWHINLPKLELWYGSEIRSYEEEEDDDYYY